MSEETPRDWRGTPISVGDTVIYGAGVGRSIAMVEAVVDGFTDAGRVWLLVRHRAYGGGWYNAKPRVHVGPDRLTVVTGLPPTELPTEGEKSEEARARMRATYEGYLADLLAGTPSLRYEWATEAYLRKQIAKFA